MVDRPATQVLSSVLRAVSIFAVVAALAVVSGTGAGVRLLAGTLIAIGGNSNPTSAGMIQELGGNPLPPGTPNPAGLPVGVAGQGYLDPANPNSPYYGYDFQAVTWPSQIPLTTHWDGDTGFEQSQRQGLANLQALLEPALQTGEPVTVAGYSSGANVVVRAMRHLQSVGAPDADRLRFLLIAGMNRPNGGLAARFPGLFLPFYNVKFDGTTPDTPYRTLDVSWQYDPVSDFPNYPLNVLADLNALVGFFTQHGNYYPADLSGPRVVPDYTDPASNITYVTLATRRLPLLVPLRLLGVPKQLLDLVEPALKVLVDLGYDRSIKSGVAAPASLSPTPQRLLALPGQLLNAVGVGIQHALNPCWDKPDPAPVTTTATRVAGAAKAVVGQSDTAEPKRVADDDTRAAAEPAHATTTDPVAPSVLAPRTAAPPADEDASAAGAGGDRSGRPVRSTPEPPNPAPVTGKHGPAAEADTHESNTPGNADDHSEDSAADKAAA